MVHVLQSTHALCFKEQGVRIILVDGTEHLLVQIDVLFGNAQCLHKVLFDPVEVQVSEHDVYQALAVPVHLLLELLCALY